MSASQRPSYYPFPTELRPLEKRDGKEAGGYGIFLTALRHKVDIAALPRWWQDARRLGWRLHEYLATPKGTRLSGRRFEPARVLSPAAAAPLLGATFLPATIEADEDAQQRLARCRLDPNDRDCGRPESLLVTLQSDHLDPVRELKVCDEWGGVDFIFHMDWVDCWFMPNGLGLLAFKVVLDSVCIGEVAYPPRVGDLGHLNRLLRYIQKQVEDEAEYNVCGPHQTCAEGIPLWKDIILKRWLGLEGQDNLLRLDPGAHPWADNYTAYAKVLTAARIPPMTAGEIETLWNIPQVDLPLNLAKIHEAIASGEWTPEFSAWSQGAIAGYPTLGDVLLYELASTSAEGAAAGLNGTRGWQVSTDYLRALFETSQIAIWEYWKGLALRDTCAFLAVDDSMPILDQAESQYYPLYAHTYYTQCRLHKLSEDIIDHDLRNVRNARSIRDQFTAFRNQFWFRETATGFQGIEIARQMRRGMELDELYDSVASEVAEVGEFIDNKIQAGRQALLGLLILLFYPFALLWGIFKDDLLTWLSDVVWPWFLGLNSVWMILIVAIVIALVVTGVNFSRNHLSAFAQRLSDWMWKRHL